MKMTKQNHANKIIADAAQVLNDYRAALAELGLPYHATPLEANARIERLKSDALEYALLLDEILGDGRVASANDFRAALSAVRLLRRKAETLLARQVTTSGTYTT